MPKLNLTPTGFDYNYVGRPDRNIKGGIKEVTSKLDAVEEHRMCQIDSGRLGEIDCEIEHCTRAITLNPNDAEAYNNRGVAYYIKGDFNCAIQDFNTAIRLKPDNADTYYNRGLAYGQKTDVDRAIQDFSQVIKLKPDDAEAYNNRGAAYAKKGDLDCALEGFTKAIEYKTSEVRFYSNRGMANYSKEEYDLARKDFGKVIELKPDCLADLIQKSDIKPPEDIAAMLTPEETGVGRQKAQNTAHPVEPDVEIAIKKIKKRYDRVWKTLANV